VSFAFRPRGDGLVVRVDTFTGTRFARTVSVPGDATSVTIRRTVRSARPHPRSRTTVRTITGPSHVADLVGLVNGLPGAMTARVVASCPAALTDRSYALTFSTPSGRYVASLPTSLCWPRLTLRHAGTAAGPPLDPGRRFVRVVDGYLR
jgi:hypothetical protein